MTLRQKTVPGVLAERARATPDAVAFRSKHLGLYRSRTWRDYAALVARCARGLKSLGLVAGERVAIMGDACEEWMIADLGAQAAGAISYGIYPTSSTSELEYQLRDAGAAIFVAENQEYVDKVLPLLARLPALRTVLVIDDSAMFAYEDERIVAWRELMAAAADASLEALAARLDPSAPAFIVYTSGTTGAPKGALVSHGVHLAAAANLLEHYPALAENDHRTVVYLPLCHVLGRDVAITLPLLGRLVPHFGEGIEDLATTFYEVAPTALFTVPRYLQKFAAQVMIGMNASTASKRWAYEAAMRVGRREAQRRWAGESDTSMHYRLARTLVFKPLLEKLGMDELELVVCGGAPLSRETMALWHIWGVNVVEIYGQTEEAGAIISGQRGPFPRPGNVGTLASGWRMRLGADNEIQIAGPHAFERYWNNDEATAAIKGGDGWLRTGDAGELDGGVLRLVDRTRDFIVTAGGKTLSPSVIENALRSSPYIAEAVVIGHARKYVAALIEIDFDTVADWARSQNVVYTGFTGLATSAAVEKLIAGELARANGELARVEQVKAFRILPKALDPETEGEPVTPTRKVKRALMVERFRELVESMYDDREERLLASGVGGALNAAS